MTSRVSVVVVVEDDEHETFIRAVLGELGHDRGRIRLLKRGTFSAVRNALREELHDIRAKRTRGPNHALVVVIDADDQTVVARQRWLEDGQTPRDRDEPIAYIVPRRHIEAWVRRLGGEEIDEVDEAGTPIAHDGGAAGNRAREGRQIRAAARAYVAQLRAASNDARFPSIPLSFAEVQRIPRAQGVD